MKLMQLLEQTSLPRGVVNLVQGRTTAVDALLAHPDVKAVTFMGSTPVAKHIYQTGCRHAKRVQANAGAKNHCVVLPDYPVHKAVQAVLGASMGAAGQRCMALSVAVVVEPADSFVQLLIAEAKNLILGRGLDDPHVGPLISPEQVQRICDWVAQSETAGAKVRVPANLPNARFCWTAATTGTQTGPRVTSWDPLCSMCPKTLDWTSRPITPNCSGRY